MAMSSKVWLKKNIGGIDISYLPHLDGGGGGFGQKFIPFLKNRNMPTQESVFEWCCGPGFIGFSLLGNCLCETLCLADINGEAIEACANTLRDNDLGGRVSTYISDNLKSIPYTEKWDLVVANPPH